MYFNNGLYFQNLQSEILEPKISQAFGLNLWRKLFILHQNARKSKFH